MPGYLPECDGENTCECADCKGSPLSWGHPTVEVKLIVLCYGCLTEVEETRTLWRDLPTYLGRKFCPACFEKFKAELRAEEASRA